ncbi:N-acetylneuraminate synthase family protein [Amylibacter sp.]|nr:N-acetylneuraminate synthase family protein [Amylibacter sp.]
MTQKFDVKIICEIASAHCGNKDELYSIIDAAIDSGCNYLKFQIFSYKSLVHNNDVFPELKKIEFSNEEWNQAIEYSYKKIELIIEPFDQLSLLNFLDDKRIFGIKIPTADLSDTESLLKIIHSGKKVFAGVGGASLEEIDDFMSYFTPLNMPILLHGFQSFPTRIEDSCLNKISELKTRYGCNVGYADHIDGASKLLAFSVPSAAILFGAEYIEKHITLKRSEKKYDYYSSLEPAEFIDFVEYIKLMNTTANYKYDLKNLNPAEKEYRNKMKKFAVTKEYYPKGTNLLDINLRYCRTAEPGLTGFDIRKMYDEDITLKVDILQNSILKKENFVG